MGSKWITPDCNQSGGRTDDWYWVDRQFDEDHLSASGLAQRESRNHQKFYKSWFGKKTIYQRKRRFVEWERLALKTGIKRYQSTQAEIIESA